MLLKIFYNLIYKYRKLIKFTPKWLNSFIKSHIKVLDYNKIQWQKERDNLNLPKQSNYKSPYEIKFGIIEDPANYHYNYIKACIDLKANYVVIDMFSSNWQYNIINSDCDLLLIWPSVNLTIWKEMFDEKLMIINKYMKMRIYPSYDELWLYENKRRLSYLLESEKIPHPKTWVFYNLEEAIEFVNSTSYPIVRKLSIGASSSGVNILKNKISAIKETRKAFNEGLTSKTLDKRDKHWGYIIFQEFIHHDFEWRIVRIGNDYLVRKKIKIGNFASGSGNVVWATPKDGLLEYTMKITDKLHITSAAIDYFEKDGKFLVNEIQPLFGDIELSNRYKNQENMGKYSYIASEEKWLFRHGYFYNNACANLRIENLINNLKKYDKYRN